MHKNSKIIISLTVLALIAFLFVLSLHKVRSNWLNGNWQNINNKQEQYTFTKTNHTLVIILPNRDEIKTKQVRHQQNKYLFKSDTGVNYHIEKITPNKIKFYQEAKQGMLGLTHQITLTKINHKN